MNVFEYLETERIILQLNKYLLLFAGKENFFHVHLVLEKGI